MSLLSKYINTYKVLNQVPAIIIQKVERSLINGEVSEWLEVTDHGSINGI